MPPVEDKLEQFINILEDIKYISLFPKLLAFQLCLNDVDCVVSSFIRHDVHMLSKMKVYLLVLEYVRERNDETEAYKVQESDLRNSNEWEQKELQEEIKETLKELSQKSLTVIIMDDTIDKLMNKVLSLEMLVSSQTALIDSLEDKDRNTRIKFTGKLLG
uniref:Kinase-interacting protein 1-like n=1 Tax=Tanacetum cinerariifolium TaxID=118510 RepID=A0A6L2LLA6_TANCI|nr:kinase-interacting protein 1-like [Tanacetum cinerariifolium]